MSFARLAQKMSGPGASNRKWGAEDWLLPEAMDVSRWMSLDWTLLPIEMCRINDILKILKSKKEESIARCLSPLGRSWPRRMPNPNQSIEFAFPVDRSWVWGIVGEATHVCWSFNESVPLHGEQYCRNDPFMQLNRIYAVPQPCLQKMLW